MRITIKNLLASLVLSFAASVAFAQGAAPVAKAQVESVNILEVNKDVQAQREKAENQPANNQPIWKSANSDQAHYVSIPNKEAGVLIQKSGQQWRLIRNGVITVWGGWLIVIMAGLILTVFVVKGKIKLHEPMTGRLMKRFSGLERFSHWLMAFSFIALAITGLLILFGKHFLLPIMGGTAYGALLLVMKNIHNFTGPLFTASILLFFVIFVKDNLPSKDDLHWLATFGGLLSGRHIPSHRFNAGEKIWFWAGVTILGMVVSGSGWVLDMIVPNMEYWRGTMQLANIIHGVAAILMTVMAMGHIYVGSIGMEGALQGMKTGYVDEAWGKEHHELWYNDVKSGKL
jgi:formate dehydrogenase subunit gamma